MPGEGARLVTTMTRHPGGASVQVHARIEESFTLVYDAIVNRGGQTAALPAAVAVGTVALTDAPALSNVGAVPEAAEATAEDGGDPDAEILHDYLTQGANLGAGFAKWSPDSGETVGQRLGVDTTSMVTATAPSDAEQAIGVIVLAFGTDPAARWTYPDPQQYLTHFPTIVRAFGGRAFAHGTGHHVSGFAGAALWLPPGVTPDEQALAAIVRASVPAARHSEVFGVFEQMGRHHPHEPHWYLPLIGVDPLHQGRGLGSALLQHALRQCDRAHVPAYLESSNPRNIGLYLRHGFEVMGEIRVGAAPLVTPMVRRPQR